MSVYKYTSRMRLLSLLLTLFVAISVCAQDRPDAPGLNRCCVAKIYDATSAEMGEVIKFNEDFVESVMMRYRLKDGDTVALRLSSEYILSGLQPGGSNVLFLTADCSGDAFVIPSKSQPMKRQAAILPVGSAGYSGATNAWLYVSAPLATRTLPAPGTLFKAQWDLTTCSPYAAPGYTYSGGTFGGYWMKRVEDMYAKWKRPYWIK